MDYMGKHVGEVVEIKGVKTYIAPKIAKKHYFVMFKGYGISLEILKKCKEEKVVDVLLEEFLADGSTKIWVTKLDWWFTHSQHWNNGEDAQKILSLQMITNLQNQ